ncbi:protein SPATA45 homolog [Babylonia areolata]|uniref:protein SPATA45 homolog n=1 Tax=Babylonia areolata TaxID=304850 RepID=UPI003FD15B91
MAEQKGSEQEQSTPLGEKRETWCAVERMKEEDWCRKNRRHYDQHLASDMFEESAPVSEERCSFEVNAPTHRERRHYPTKHLVSQWTTM